MAVRTRDKGVQAMGEIGDEAMTEAKYLTDLAAFMTIVGTEHQPHPMDAEVKAALQEHSAEAQAMVMMELGMTPRLIINRPAGMSAHRTPEEDAIVNAALQRARSLRKQS